MSKLNQLIGFLEEQLTVSEPTPDYTRHNQEIITYIEYLKSMKQPQLNENQQIVLDWLKDRFNETEIKASCTGYLWKLHQSYIDDEADEAGIAYEELSYEEESEVVRVFAEWFEQERK
ncbi:hypothetical protein OPM42_000212 [Enterococcus faecalis]|uniref:hypothetical protein n=1 Tax=Enterococcus TaxID=1350 RepID=UPI000CF2C686|nr:hypothetical protein [Enterococcus faecalis]EGO2733856.1 hypothetical protein [Enterococcus faecalis]EGO2821423.1 hypothetical protein [Enterococcus faecalis]EGO7555961.1 hypothetical protein [Enterococcus faecalis]EGO7924694.1 hypothetical protein [Enterococcus faecalis]EGO8089953.1 hypothetical protein [Enterococcus faecalis]